MLNSKQWELELEEYGSMHNEGCPCMLEDPDGCDCDMHGLKPLFRNAINQAVEESLSELVKQVEGLKKKHRITSEEHGFVQSNEVINIIDNVLSLLKGDV